MPELNLLENRLRDTTYARERQIKLALSFLTVVLVILIVFTIGIFILNRALAKQIADTSASNQMLQSKLSVQSKPLDDAKIYQAQLDNLQTLLKNHIYLSPLLDLLEKTTYVKSQDTSLDISNNGEIHLEGKVATYKDLGSLMLGLSTSQQFKNVNLISVLPAGDLVQNSFKFSIDMTISPDIFYKK